MNWELKNQAGERVGEIQLADEIFAAPVNLALLHQAVVRHQANQRQGTSKVKTRTEVAGGGRKPWRQKGTGRARAGSIRSPLWRKGGVVFGPAPREHRQDLPKKARRAALRSALSSKVQDQQLIVLDELRIPEPKTRVAAEVLAKLEAPRALVVVDRIDQPILLSMRNLPGAIVQEARDLNAYEVLRYAKLVLTQAAARAIEEALK